MQKLLSNLYLMYFFASSGVLVVVAAILCILTAPFDPNRRILHVFASWWGHHYMDIVPGWRVHFEGLDNIDPKKAYVLVANHQSLADILVLYGLYKPYKWVSKEEVFKTPFVGWNMMLNQHVKIKRGDMKSIKEMMAISKNWLKRGVSLMMFPEGTRSEDGELQPFRDGAFRLAMDANVDVVPIVIDGTHPILPKGQRLINFKSDIHIKILPPISGAPFENSSGKMRNYVQDVMAKTLAEMRKERSFKPAPFPAQYPSLVCFCRRENALRVVNAEDHIKAER